MAIFKKSNGTIKTKYIAITLLAAATFWGGICHAAGEQRSALDAATSKGHAIKSMTL